MNTIQNILKNYFPLFLVSLIQVYLLNAYSPLTGTDVGYYSSKLLDLLLHFKCEGLFATQWWTPSFGAGIPGFPSPVHYQYSITPYLMLIFNPWISTVLTYLIFNGIGYFLVLNYLSKHLNLCYNSSVAGAVVFSTSGFWISHSLIGHLSYHTFSLIALVPYILKSNWSTSKKTILFSLSVIYMIHSGAYFPIYLLYLSFAQLFFLFLIIDKIKIKNVLKAFIISHVIIFGVSMSKIVAVLMHMDVIPRLNEYTSWQSYFIALPFANLFQLFSWRLLYPFESLLPIPADSILFWVCGSRYEFWENDCSVSPIVLPTIAYFIYKFRKFIATKIINKKLYFLFLFISLWMTAEISIGKGVFWHIIKDMPFIKSTHVNVRYCGSIILLVTIVFSYSYHYLIKFNLIKKDLLLFYSIILISLLSALSYVSFIDRKNAFLAHDHSTENEIWANIQNGNNMVPITEIIDTPGTDHLSHFNRNASSYMPHDPLYGYHGHYFLPATKVGKTMFIGENGNYNFHNPMSFYNPKVKDAKRELIHESDSKNFELLINRKQPDWELPRVQKIANYLTMISLFFFTSFIAFATLKSISNRFIN